MAGQQMVFNPVSGLLKYEGGRVLNLNGINLDVPEHGFAFVAFQLIPIDGVLMPCAREIKGPTAMRYGAMKFGETELQAARDQADAFEGDGIPFTFAFGNPRPRYSVN